MVWGGLEQGFHSGRDVRVPGGAEGGGSSGGHSMAGLRYFPKKTWLRIDRCLIRIQPNKKKRSNTSCLLLCANVIALGNSRSFNKPYRAS